LRVLQVGAGVHLMIDRKARLRRRFGTASMELFGLGSVKSSLLLGLQLFQL